MEETQSAWNHVISENLLERVDFAKLRSMDTCTVSNAIERLDMGMRNEGFASGAICCQFPNLGPMVGHAVTGRIRTSFPPMTHRCVEEPLPTAPPATPNDLVAQAIGNRPELASLRFSRDAAYKFYEAEKDLSRPTVSAVAVGGFLPYINSTGVPAEYEGIAANVSFPVFNGHLFSARREAALQRAMESDQHLRDQQENIARDVRVAWAAANDAYQRIDVTSQFLRQASLGLDLAQGRYQLGLASIVELTQAQLSLTQAEIENLTAKYDYQTQNSVLQYTLGALR